MIFTRPMTIYNSSEPINRAPFFFFKSEAFTFSSASLIEFIQLWSEKLQHIERFSRPSYIIGYISFHIIGYISFHIQRALVE